MVCSGSYFNGLFEVPAWLQFANGIFLVLYACCVIEIGRNIYGAWSFVIVRAAIVGVLTFTVEWVGITTDFPFGAYDYYPTLGFLVAGVPLTIAFAWVGVFLNSLFYQDNNRSGSEPSKRVYGLCCLISY